MPITLPALTPSDREFTVADYPLVAGEWRGGVASYPQGFSDTPVSAGLRLQYRNILDAPAALFLAAWWQSLSGLLPLTLPTAVVEGISDAALASRILQPPGLTWRFAKAPTVTSVAPGISSASIELIAEADFSLPTAG